MERTEVRTPLVNDGHTCSACKHVARVPVADGAVQTECRRNPPTVVGSAVHIGNGNFQVPHATYFPIIGDATATWCGRFGPRLDG